MLSPILETLLRGADATSLTDFFLFSLIILFILSLIWKKHDKHHAFTSYTPTLLTSLGILGTFTGIISGLLDFNTNDIDASIGPLLAGLKTAFITSLAGMLLSIFYKIIISTGVFSRVNEVGVNEAEIDIGDLYQVMKQQADGIEQLKKSISENDETSLVGQFKLLRSDLSDNHKTINQNLTNSSESLTGLLDLSKQHQQHFKDFEDRLWIKLQDFADMLSKSATEQVIEALKEVIQDFNNHLVEQFGENFKALNEAVLKLVVWQDNYKEQLSDMKVQYEHGVQAITKTEESVNNISNEAKIIPETMNNLKSVMEINQHQITELDRHLDAFKDIRDKAVEAVPEIKGQIEMAIAGAKEANDKLASGITESSEHIKTVIVESADNYRNTVDQTRAALTESAQATANSSEEIKETFSVAVQDINANMRELISELQNGSKSVTDNYKEASSQMMSDTQDVSKAFSQGMDEMRQTLSSTIEEQAVEHRRQADKVFSGLERSIEEALSQTGESVQKQVTMIDQTMGQEIEKVMQSMGSALVSISGKFTDDYSRLVRQMSDIVKQQA
jgi:chromosome segregation ATPase